MIIINIIVNSLVLEHTFVESKSWGWATEQLPDGRKVTHSLAAWCT